MLSQVDDLLGGTKEVGLRLVGEEALVFDFEHVQSDRFSDVDVLGRVGWGVQTTSVKGCSSHERERRGEDDKR
jgi:hypothetical protein